MTAINPRSINKLLTRAARCATFCLFAMLAALCLSPQTHAQWVTNGTTTTTTGNVGVGTTTPEGLLDVGDTNIRLKVTTTDLTDRYGLRVGDSGRKVVISSERGTSQQALVFGDTTLGNIFGIGTSGDTGASWSSRFVVNQNGNVGIGTNTPSQALHVRGQGLFQNTGTASAFVMDRTDGKIASFGAGGASATFAYDNTGIFKIESNTRANINAGAFGTGATTRLMINAAGNVGVGTDAPTAKLHVAGDVIIDGNISAKYQDVAEWVPSRQKLNAGTVVILDAERSNQVLASTTSYDTSVAGVISAQPGLSLGEAGEGKVLVATTGRVKVKVDATRAPIKVGDLLVTSDVVGVAMKSEAVKVSGISMHRPGTIIGKALEPLAGGTGEILVLLSLQ